MFHSAIIQLLHKIGEWIISKSKKDVNKFEQI